MSIRLSSSRLPDRQLRLHAARIHGAVGLDRHFGAVVLVPQEIEPARPPVAEIVGERRVRQVVLPRAAARPQLADPRVGRRAEEAEHRARLLVPVARGGGQARTPHAVPLEQRGQLVHERLLLRRAFEPHVEIVDARDRDHPHAAREQVVDDRIGEDVAGRLHDDLHAALRRVAVAQHLDHLVRDALAHGIEQRLAARQDHAPGLLRKRAVRLRIVEVAIGEALGEVGDDAREVALGLLHDRFELAADVRPEPVLVAVLALAVASPGHHVVDRFHAGETVARAVEWSGELCRIGTRSPPERRRARMLPDGARRMACVGARRRRHYSACVWTAPWRRPPATRVTRRPLGRRLGRRRQLRLQILARIARAAARGVTTWKSNASASAGGPPRLRFQEPDADRHLAPSALSQYGTPDVAARVTVAGQQHDATRR